MLAEITEPVDLCLPSGALNPAAVGWTRTPLHRANLRQSGDVRETLTDALGRAAMWSRTKRWEYWCVITPTHVLALTVTALNYAGHHQVWLLDRTTGTETDCTATAPFARDVRMPSRPGAGPVRGRSGPVAIAVDPEPGDGPRPGSRIRAVTPRVRVDLTVEVPSGQECLGVVVAWSERLFQYTLKDVALPVRGTIWVDDVEVAVDAADSWAVMDFGRGRWPYSVVWNWGAGSGVVDGVVTGLQLGGKWTDGTGSTENALVLDGRVHYLGEDLSWAYDVADRTAPWFVTGPRVQVRLQPFHVRESALNLGIISSTTVQSFGTWTGWVVDDDGTRRARRRPRAAQGGLDQGMRTTDVVPADLEALAGALDEMSARRLEAGAQRARRLLAGRTVWNVSGTELGGVGELLRSLLPYAAGGGVRVRWLVLDGDPEFTRLTARLTHALHGAGDGDGLGPDEMTHYERVLERNLAEVRESVSPGDVVVLHDPATAGLAAGLRRRGAHVVWRSHVGADVPDEVSERAWAFLEPYLADAERVVLTRAVYRPGFLEPATVRVIAPSIDPLSPKNRPLAESEVSGLLRGAGVLAGSAGAGAGSVVAAGGPVPADARVVLQLSKWDRLKDMTGVLIAFDESFEELPSGTHLLLAGAEVHEDDAAGAEVLSHCLQMWQGLEEEVRAHVHVLCLPNTTEHNALLVNAVQRHATVVVQKSLAEGFGLTVAEALWKGKPVVATAVGGIQDQITDGENGLLVRDPTDLQGVMRHVSRLLAEPAFAAQLGAAAHDRVQRDFLSDRHLLQYVDLVAEMLD